MNEQCNYLWIALGNISDEKEAIYMEKPKTNTNSTKGLGRIGPSLEDSYMTNGEFLVTTSIHFKGNCDLFARQMNSLFTMKAK
jgi:hypothetical protein